MTDRGAFLDRVRVHALPGAPSRGMLHAGPLRFEVALGRGGIVADKREGDGGTPAGEWGLRRLFFRPDRLAPPATGLPVERIGPRHGWSDDPADPDYNRLVLHPETGERGFSAERMYRDDHLYDIVIVVAHNDAPPEPGKGSAIFIHLMRGDFEPTQGCIALRRDDMLELAARLGPQTLVAIEPGS